MKLTQWDSITGSSIAVGNVCHVRQPRLSEVRQLGYDKFFGYVSVIMFDPSELDGQIPMLIPDLSTFYILITYPMLRETFFEALSFFIEEEVVFDDKSLCFKVYRNKQVVGEINNGNFGDIQSLIVQIIGVEKESKSELKFSNKKAKAIYERCKARKKEFDTRRPRTTRLFLTEWLRTSALPRPTSLCRVLTVATPLLSLSPATLWQTVTTTFLTLFGRMRRSNQYG